MQNNYNEWQEVKLADICEIKSGKRLPEGHSLVDFPTKNPYIKARDIRNGKISNNNLQYLEENTWKQIKKYIVNQDDVCITIVANIGDVGIVPEHLEGANLTENAVRLTNFEPNIFPLFLNYLLSSVYYKEYMELMAAGSAQAKLGIYKVKEIKIKLPPLETQKQIASILSAYDDQIENNLQRIAILEKSAQDLYKEWFVRFRINGEAFPTDTETGLPAGWELKYFKDFIKLNRGFDLPDDKIEEGIYPVIASTSIKAFHKEYKVKAPCVTTGRSGTLGVVLYVDSDGWPLNTSLYVKDFKGNSPIFVYYLLQELHLETFNAGAGVPTLNQNHLHNLKIFVPNTALQQNFENHIKTIFSQIQTLQEANQTLRQTRDRLLPRLMSGELQPQNIQL